MYSLVTDILIMISRLVFHYFLILIFIKHFLINSKGKGYWTKVRKILKSKFITIFSAICLDKPECIRVRCCEFQSVTWQPEEIRFLPSPIARWPRGCLSPVWSSTVHRSLLWPAQDEARCTFDSRDIIYEEWTILINVFTLCPTKYKYKVKALKNEGSLRGNSIIVQDFQTLLQNSTDLIDKNQYRYSGIW